MSDCLKRPTIHYTGAAAVQLTHFYSSVDCPGYLNSLWTLSSTRGGRGHAPGRSCPPASDSGRIRSGPHIPLRCSFSIKNLLILLKMNVATHHVIEQDTQGPLGGRVTRIFTTLYPFRWRIHSGAIKLCVRRILDKSSSAKVN